MRSRVRNTLITGGTALLALWLCGELVQRGSVTVLAHGSEMIGVNYVMPEQCGTGRELQHAARGLLYQLGDMNPALLQEMLYSGDPQVRAASALVLGAKRDPSAFAPILRLTADPDVRVRRCALGAAAQYGDKRIIPLVIRALHDPDQRTQRAAQCALKSVAYRFPEAKQALDEWLDQRAAAARAGTAGRG